MRPTLFYIVFIVLVLTISISSAISDQKGIVMNVDANGKVLGVSETAVYAPLENLGNIGSSFPQSPNRQLVLPTKKEGSEDYELSSSAGVVVDCASGEVIYSKNHNQELPIASITKIATALTFLDFNPGWEEYYKIQTRDITNGGRIYLSAGDEVKIKDLFNLSLVGSANTAARALANATKIGEDGFIKAMNERVAKLGFKNTQFSDPIGISRFNISTAAEVAQLLQVALNSDVIQEATIRKGYSFKTKQGKSISVANTDDLLEVYPQDGINILGGKTGHTNIAGYCFTAKFKNEEGRELISVVLGDTGKYSRFKKTKELINWAYNNYIW